MEGCSGNGAGWSQTGPDDALGTLALWGEAPPGAERVRVRFGAEVGEESVVAGRLFGGVVGSAVPGLERVGGRRGVLCRRRVA